MAILVIFPTGQVNSTRFLNPTARGPCIRGGYPAIISGQTTHPWGRAKVEELCHFRP